MKKIIFILTVLLVFPLCAQDNSEFKLYKNNFEKNLKVNRDSSTLYLEQMKGFISEDAYKFNLSRINYHWGKIEKAEEEINKLLKKKIEDKTLLINIKRYKSYLLRDAGNTTESLVLLQECSSSAKEVGDQLLEHQINKEIAMTLTASRNESEAVVYLEKAISYFEKQNNKEQLASSYNFYISILLTLNKREKAIVTIDKLRGIGEELNDPYIIADCNYQLGTLYVDQGKYDKAAPLFEEAKVGYSQLGTYEPLSIININLYRCSAELGDFKKAKIYLDSATYYAELLGSEELILFEKWYRYDYFMKIKDYKNAVTIFDEYVTMKDSLYGAQNSELINDLNLKYQSAEKDKTILQKDLDLKSKNEKLNKQSFWIWIISISVVLLTFIVLLFFYFNRKQRRLNTELIRLNRFKNQLFTIIGHDLRSPIAQIISHKENTEEKATVALSILDNLLVWGNLNENEVNSKEEIVPFEIVLDELEEEFKSLLNSKGLKMKLNLVQNDSFVMNKYELEVVLRNLLSNAVKYSKENTEIVVSNIDGQVTIENEIDSKIESGSQIGLEIVRTLCAKNNFVFVFEKKDKAIAIIKAV